MHDGHFRSRNIENTYGFLESKIEIVIVISISNNTFIKSVHSRPINPIYKKNTVQMPLVFRSSRLPVARVEHLLIKGVHCNKILGNNIVGVQLQDAGASAMFYCKIICACHIKRATSRNLQTQVCGYLLV
jgi:hypothetical protein